jgi:hypothetical protein
MNILPSWIFIVSVNNIQNIHILPSNTQKMSNIYIRQNEKNTVKKYCINKQNEEVSQDFGFTSCQSFCSPGYKHGFWTVTRVRVTKMTIYTLWNITFDHMLTIQSSRHPSTIIRFYNNNVFGQTSSFCLLIQYFLTVCF